ncbi:MAG TPA: histidine kinase dimerization/phospho-acceptor domain-containing protein, partial [Longimicrobiaceae bacterium]
MIAVEQGAGYGPARRDEDCGPRLAREREAVRVRDEVLATVAHDLRSPLGTILMAAELALDPVVPEERRASALSRIRTVAEGMNRLIQDLLDVSHLESGRIRMELQPVAVEPLVAAVAGMSFPGARG